MSVRRAAHGTRNRRPAAACAAFFTYTNQLTTWTANKTRLVHTATRHTHRTSGHSHHCLTSRQNAQARFPTPPETSSGRRLSAFVSGRPLPRPCAPPCRPPAASTLHRALPARIRSPAIRTALQNFLLRVSFRLPHGCYPAFSAPGKSKTRRRLVSAAGFFARERNDSSTNALLSEIPGRRSRCLPATECPFAPRRRRIPASSGAARVAVSFRSCASCGRASFLHALSCAKCARQRAIHLVAEGENSQKGKNRKPTFQQFRRLTWRNVFRSGEATSSRPRRLAPTPVMRTS